MTAGPQLRWASTLEGQRWMLRGVAVLLVVGIASCVLVGANRPADPRLLPASARLGLIGHSSTTSRVPGFGHIGFRVVSAKGVGTQRCALLADNDAQRAKGLMGRRNLAGYDAMVFRFGSDVTTPFYNKDVPIALSVAWFDAAGVYVGDANMPVCLDPCPLFGPSVPYRFGLEVRRGGLGRLGIGNGSVLTVGGSCGPA